MADTGSAPIGDSAQKSAVRQGRGVARRPEASLQAGPRPAEAYLTKKKQYRRNSYNRAVGQAFAMAMLQARHDLFDTNGSTG